MELLGFRVGSGRSVMLPTTFMSVWSAALRGAQYLEKYWLNPELPKGLPLMNEQTSVPFRWRSPFDLNHPAGGLLSGVVAGLIAGLITGIAARLVMRIIVLAIGVSPVFTVNGTLVILKYGAIFGIILGIIFGFFQPLYAGSVLKKGVKYGLFWSTLFTLIVYSSAREGFAGIPITLALPLFALLPLIYGLILGWTTVRLIPKDQMNGNELAQTAT
jgi:hypothetical protein